MRSKALVGAALLAATLALTACNDSSGSESSSSDGFSAEAKSDAQKMVDQYSSFPSAPDLKPLSQKPSADHLVVMISCPLPACTGEADAFQEAAGKLGWQSKVVVSNFSPDEYIAAWDSALALKPDGISYIALLPNSTVQSALDRAKAAGTWVVEGAPAPDVTIGGDSPISGAVQPNERTATLAKLQASLVITDAKATDGIAFLYSPGAPTYKYSADQFETTIKNAGGTVDLLDLNQQDIGSKVPQEVVSYLQSHPKTHYLVAVDDSWFAGVAEAIKAAGIPSPKLVGGGIADDSVRARIQSGQEFASASGDLTTDGWNAVDLMARFSVQEQPDDLEPVGVVWLVNKSNVDQYPDVFPGIPDAYTKAWGVS